MNFLKSNMLYNHYSWTAIRGDDPKVSGVPDSTLFNRNEGYEVLYLINRILEDNNISNVSTGQKMEQMLFKGLPGNIRSQTNVYTWIVDNWSRY